jgi:hypothetical protein
MSGTTDLAVAPKIDERKRPDTTERLRVTHLVLKSEHLARGLWEKNIQTSCPQVYIFSCKMHY